MEFSKALNQISEIHDQLAKGEIYRGLRSIPVCQNLLDPFRRLASPADLDQRADDIAHHIVKKTVCSDRNIDIVKASLGRLAQIETGNGSYGGCPF